MLQQYALQISVEIIENGAFEECSSLTGMMIPESVVEIQPDAFRSCDSLVLTVKKDTAAYRYCIDNDVPYYCMEELDWLK